MAGVDRAALREGAREVARRLRTAGFEAYLAGGCVRDLLLGAPPKDWDIVTNARPPQVTKLFRRTVQVGAAFGVVRVLLDRGRDYEVATYREDRGYSDGRHPDEVRYSDDMREDVKRRDFTINALLMDPETNEVLDFVGGREDLERRVIRAVGDPGARFREDRLRMLRAVRFAARLGFPIEPATFEVIRTEAPAISIVSVERIVAELEGIFLSKDPRLGLELLVDTGLFAAILPKIELGEARGVLGARFTRLPLAGVEGRARALVAWAALLERAQTSDLEVDLRELKLSRSDLRTIQRLVEAKGLLVDPARFSEAARVRISIDPEVSLFLAFAEVLVGKDGEALSVWHQGRRALEAQPLPPLPVLRGDDLKALGLAPGRHFKELLEAVETEVLERRISTKEEALDFVRAKLAP